MLVTRLKQEECRIEYNLIPMWYTMTWCVLGGGGGGGWLAGLMGLTKNLTKNPKYIHACESR